MVPHALLVLNGNNGIINGLIRRVHNYRFTISYIIVVVVVVVVVVMVVVVVVAVLLNVVVSVLGLGGVVVVRYDG